MQQLDKLRRNKGKKTAKERGKKLYLKNNFTFYANKLRFMQNITCIERKIVVSLHQDD